MTDLPERFLSKREIQHITGKSSVTIWRWCRSGVFPSSYKIGPRSVGWAESEIIEWQEGIKLAAKLAK